MIAGGVDYGERDTAIANAEMIRSMNLKIPVVYAGNVENQEEMRLIFPEEVHPAQHPKRHNSCACFYSDATVLSSATCEIDNMSHAVSQFPYVLISAALAVSGFLICGIFAL